jgi:uncharacterized protein
MEAGQIAALDKLYAELPTIACKRLCQECCGPIMLSRVESERLEQRKGVVRIARYYKDSVLLEVKADLRCQFLAPVIGTCMVYADRPLICRLFGLVPEMRCPHGCEPSRWASKNEVENLFRRILEI